MLMFPPEYSQLSLPPGYVWNFKTKKLYSYKSGMLKELKLRKPWRGSHYYKLWEPYYSMSHKGRSRHVTLSSLMKATENYETTFVMEKKNA